MGLYIDLNVDNRIIPEVYAKVAHATGAKGGGIYALRLHFVKNGAPFVVVSESISLDIPFVSDPKSANPWQSVGVAFDLNRPSHEQAYEDFKAKASAGLIPWALNVRDD